MKITKNIALAVIAMQSVVSVAQEVQNDTIKKTNRLNEVEITATSQTEKSLLNQPQSISKLETKELKRGTGLFLADAINTNATGVFMSSRTSSAGQQLNIRGYGNGLRGTNGTNSNFDIQGTKVYLNNIPLTDAEGITILDDIDFNSLGNVEISKGPSGSLYGLAIAGAVNLKTISPEAEKTSISQNTLFGSYGLKRLTTELQIGGKKSSLLVNYGNQRYDGFMRHTAAQKDFVNAFADFNVSDKQKVNAYIGYSNSYEQRNGELTIAQYENNDYSGNTAYINNNAHSNVISFRAGLNHTYQFCKNFSNSTAVFGTGISNNASSAGGWTDKQSLNYGTRSTFDTKFEINENFKLSGITGLEMQQQNAETVGSVMKNGQIHAIRSDIYTISKTNSLFTEWTLSMPLDFSFTAGVGSSYMGIESQDRFPFTLSNPNNPGTPPVYTTNLTPANYQVSYKGLVSPKFAINKVFNNNISVYASYNKGYKAPVSSYLFITTTNTANTSLRPEVGTQFEVGTKGKLIDNRLSYELAAYKTTFADKMTTVSITNPNNTATLYTYVINGGDQIHKGVEASVKYEIVKSENSFFTSIVPFANTTFADYTYDNFKFSRTYNNGANQNIYDFSDRNVLGIPKWVVNAGTDFNTKLGIYGNVTFNHRDEMNFAYVPATASDPNISVSTARGYNLLNSKLGFQKTIMNHFVLDAYAGVNNITNTKYYQMVFNNQLPDAYIPAPRSATFFGGLNLKYTF